MREQEKINIDWITVLLYIILVSLGWVSIYSSAYNPDHRNIYDFDMNYGKQLIWIITAFVIAFVVLMVDVKFYEVFGYFIYGLIILLLLSVLFLGREVAGSKSWFEIGSIRIQPSEFAKFATCIALAKVLSGLNVSLLQFKTQIKVFAILIIPIALILLQNDTGSALVYFSFYLLLYREGLSGKFFIFGLYLVLLFILALLFAKSYFWPFMIILFICFVLFSILFRRMKNYLAILSFSFLFSVFFIVSVDYFFNKVLESHQQDRINVLLGVTQDPRGIGYNVNQSKIAIGSGGFSGKGFLEGTQTKFKFVPEQSTDFIFCTVGEEFGFIGSSVVIILFVVLLMRIIFIAERQRSVFGKIYGYGVASLIFFHFFINIGMTIGLVPVIGIPLPFFSYGGSSLWSFTMLLFVLLKFDSSRLFILR